MSIVNRKNIKPRNITITNMLILLLFSFASMDLFQYEGRTFFFYIGLIFLIYSMLLNRRRLHFICDPLIIAIFLEFFLSGILAQLGNMSSEYKKTALVMPLLVFPIFLEASMFEKIIIKNKNTIMLIIKGIKIACSIQFIYIPLQYISYHFKTIDLNKIIFVNALGMVKNASFIRDWVWYPSGVTYHSAIIAPLMVLGIVLFRNSFFRILIIVDAFICGNSSALIGVCVTVMLLFFSQCLDRNKSSKIKKRAIFTAMGVLIFIAIILLSTDVLSMAMDKIGYISARLLSSSKDTSTNAHLSYYYRYPQIFSKNTIIQNLFGYGYSCSGSVFSNLDNRFNIGSWAVESDIMDRLYSLGIVGFVLYYTFLAKIAIKGRHIDRRYAIIMIAIIIQGFGYNLQWDYVFLFELILYICIRKKINIFNFI